MNEVKDFFEEALKEAGVKNASVFHESNSGLVDTLYVTKEVRGEDLSYKVAVPTEMGMNRIKKELALHADKIKKEFDEHLVTQFNWDNRYINVSQYNGGWAECQHCGTRVDAPRTEYLVSSGEELSDPFPVSRDITYGVKNMNDLQENALKLYLIGRLREKCKPGCPNSKYNDRKI